MTRDQQQVPVAVVVEDGGHGLASRESEQPLNRLDGFTDRIDPVEHGLGLPRVPDRLARRGGDNDPGAGEP